MKFTGTLLLLLSLFSFIACSRGNSGDDASNNISFNNKVQAQESFESVSIQCGEKDLSCPEYAAGVSILLHNPSLEKPWSSQVCSGTLIAHNKILTNDHCLGSTLIKENGSCDGKVKIFFPKTNSKPAEVVDCLKIYKSSEQTSNSAQRPDWVILELKNSVSRKAALINTEGLQVGKKVTGYPVLYSKNKNNFDGTILSNTCTSTMEHYYSAYYFHEKSAIVTAAQCSQGLLPGTSGTGYFNTDNELKFVGSFSVSTEKEKDYQEIKYFKQTHKLKNNFVGGTNISCISEFNPTPSNFCFFSHTLNFIGLLNNSRFSYTQYENISEKLDLHREENSHIRWEKTDQNSTYFIQTVNNLNEHYNKKPEVSIFEHISIPSEIINFLALKIAKITYPLTPICLSANLFSSNKAEVPYMEINSQNMDISDTGLVSYPHELDFIKVDFLKNESGSYDAELLRMNPSQSMDYLKYEQAIVSPLVNCRASGEESTDDVHPCTLLESKEKELNQWMTDNGIESYLRRNEIIALSLDGKDFDLTIPSCKK